MALQTQNDRARLVHVGVTVKLCPVCQHELALRDYGHIATCPVHGEFAGREIPAEKAPA